MMKSHEKNNSLGKADSAISTKLSNQDIYRMQKQNNILIQLLNILNILKVWDILRNRSSCSLVQKWRIWSKYPL